MCNGLVCNGLVCNGFVCNDLVCNGFVCNDLVCNGLVCNGLVCNGPRVPSGGGSYPLRHPLQPLHSSQPLPSLHPFSATQVEEIRILYANQTEKDILCQDLLDECLKDPRVKVWYTVDRAPPGWKYSTGFIDEAMIREHMPPPADDTVVFMCGPPPMLKFACIPNLNKVGHSEANYFSF